MLKVGLILPLRGTWRGGLNYYHNLLSCYQQNPDPSIKLEVFTDEIENVVRYRGDAIEVHFSPEVKNLSLRKPQHWKRILGNELRRYDAALLKIVERSGVDMLTHNSVGHQKNVDTLFWQADLQHKVYPHLFAAREQRRRNIEIGNTALWGKILLSSQTAANHLRHYYPELSSVQTHILRFSSAAVLNTEPMSRQDLDAQYPTSGHYFFLPNQFWEHKNHGVVIEALRLAPPNIRVICTGPMHDSRNASYVPELMDRVKNAGLEDRFVCLGTVPYPTLVSLMHYAVAIIQPSLFEGWSTSVEEAKAMSKQVILSDIEVHKEQAPPRGIYFSPHSPVDLASAMASTLDRFDLEKEERFTEERPKNKARIEREWIEQFANILKLSSRTLQPALNK